MKFRSLIAVSAVAACFILGAASVSAAEVSFSDVNYNDASGTAIKKMTDAGYLKGYPDGTFKPDAPITRAELTTVFNNVFGYTEVTGSNINDFTDNSNPNAWYYNAVRIAQSNGYINGFEDNTFRPQNNFTREQTSVVIALAAKLENKEIKPEILDDVSPWAAQYVDTVINNDIIPLEAGLFRAKDNITRAEVCKALAHFVTETETTTLITESTSESTTAAVTEKKTETTTKKTTSVGGNGSSGGSGSGSGNSSGNSSGSSSGNSSGNSNGSSSGNSSSGNNNTTTTTTTTETTTEATTSAPASEPSEIVLSDEQMEALKRTINTTSDTVLIGVKTDSLKELTRFILNAMTSYYNDNSYDIVSAAKEAKSMYDALPSEEKQNFKDVCMRSYNLSDISLLQDVFGPILGL